MPSNNPGSNPTSHGPPTLLHQPTSLHQHKIYGKIERIKLIEVALFITIYGKVTIEQFTEECAFAQKTFAFIGIISDMYPLLSVKRTGNGQDEYRWANQEYEEAFKKIFEGTNDEYSVEAMHQFLDMLKCRSEILCEIIDANEYSNEIFITKIELMSWINSLKELIELNPEISIRFLSNFEYHNMYVQIKKAYELLGNRNSLVDEIVDYADWKLVGYYTASYFVNDVIPMNDLFEKICLDQIWTIDRYIVKDIVIEMVEKCLAGLSDERFTEWLPYIVLPDVSEDLRYVMDSFLDANNHSKEIAMFQDQSKMTLAANYMLIYEQQVLQSIQNGEYKPVTEDDCVIKRLDNGIPIKSFYYSMMDLAPFIEDEKLKHKLFSICVCESLLAHRILNDNYLFAINSDCYDEFITDDDILSWLLESNVFKNVDDINNEYTIMLDEKNEEEAKARELRRKNNSILHPTDDDIKRNREIAVSEQFFIDRFDLYIESSRKQAENIFRLKDFKNNEFAFPSLDACALWEYLRENDKQLNNRLLDMLFKGHKILMSVDYKFAKFNTDESYEIAEILLADMEAMGYLARRFVENNVHEKRIDGFDKRLDELLDAYLLWAEFLGPNNYDTNSIYSMLGDVIRAMYTIGNIDGLLVFAGRVIAVIETIKKDADKWISESYDAWINELKQIIHYFKNDLSGIPFVISYEAYICNGMRVRLINMNNKDEKILCKLYHSGIRNL